MSKLFISPNYRQPDRADGGIRRVVEAQNKYLPQYGFELVKSVDEADLVASHALEAVTVPTSIPWVLHCHGVYYQEFGWNANYYQATNRRLADLLISADYVTAPSEWIAQTLRRAMWNNPKILMHGVDPEDWHNDGNYESYILWNKARQDAASNPEPLNELARRLPKQQFVTTFGDKAPNVTITGAVPYNEATNYIKRAGLYLSTAQETFGIGTLEAMASGVPIIGWDFGGNSEIVIHKETGYLAYPGDYDDLIKGIEWCFKNRKALSIACQTDVAQRWTWKQAIERYAEYYNEILKPKEAAPKVSVVIPCYNLARFLPEAIDSVLNQTMKDYEIIILDDNSTDDTAEVAEKYIKAREFNDAQISYFKNEKNMHVSYTRNKGIAASSGKYILCLDADDMLTPNTLEVLSNWLDEDRRLHLAYGGLQIMSESGQIREGRHEWPVLFDLNKQITNQNCVPTVCMFRRQAWERAGGYRMGINPVEDADLWTRMATIGCTPVKVTDEPTFYYRLRPDSISRTMDKPRWDAWYNPDNTTFVADERKPPRTYLPTKVSVIIPVGPGHEYIVRDAIDSVYLQTLENWECIVINDTGTALPYAPSWCKLLDTGGNKGVAYARNLGIKASVAKLFVPLDADDYLQPEALEILVKYYNQFNGVIYSQWYDQTEKTIVYDPPSYNAKLLISKGCIHAITALYPKDVWELVGGFDEELTHWEDWDFQLALADKGVCGTKIPMPLWTYRKLTGSRREENIKSFEQGKEAILSKWSKFWNGEDPMACGGCSRGGGVYVNKSAVNGPKAAPSPQMASSSGSDMLLLEFVGSGGARTFIGQSTHSTYRFGSDKDHRVRMVHKADAEELLRIQGQFRVYDRTPEPV
jgi:glycosyltransferase involved in cell wall biosynthesis